MAETVKALRVGPVAAEILATVGETEVIAVFERCFYAGGPGGIVCVGVPAIGDGPINVLLQSDAAAPDWCAMGIAREVKGRVRRRQLEIGEAFVLDHAAVPVWQPPPWPTPDPQRLRVALGAARREMSRIGVDEGLAPLLFGGAAGRRNRTAAAAAEIVGAFGPALAASLSEHAPTAELVSTATLLIGLGEGLTPSGDDFLGGAFLALSAMQQGALRDALWAAIEPELDALTVVISAAHLASAADGLGAASIHDLLSAIVDGDAEAVTGALPKLSAIGHTSGFDTFAGIVAALDVLAGGDVRDGGKASSRGF